MKQDSSDKTQSLEGAVGDLVSVQPGTVVSREILKKNGGTVTLFAFDRGQGLSEHSAPFDALVLGIEGNAHIRIGTESHLVTEGGLLLMPADIPHALEAHEPFKMMLVMIRTQ